MTDPLCAHQCQYTEAGHIEYATLIGHKFQPATPSPDTLDEIADDVRYAGGGGTSGYAVGEALTDELRRHVASRRWSSSDCAECVAADATGIR